MPDPLFLIYDTEEQALLRSEQAGSMKGLSWSINGTGSRYWWPTKTEAKEDNPRAAIILETTTENEIDEETLEVIEERIVIVDSDLLTFDEQLDVVQELPSDWVHPPEELPREPQRARDAEGKFIADDPNTPDVDEAWEQPND
tara:strand:+ start:526 stop:954 length:429 start_codon:yes stop_codon:yes gene_type:complete